MNIKKDYIGKYVRITKISSLNDFSRLNDHTKSLPDEPWWCEGYVEYFDYFIQILRIRNYNYQNGKLGFFYTSHINEVKDDEVGLVIITNNSIYRVEEVEPFVQKFEMVKE